MDQQPPKDWEALLDRQLRELPEVPAPPTLIPRVMALLQARARLPWWRRTWWTWPQSVKALSLALVGGLIFGLTYGLASFAASNPEAALLSTLSERLTAAAAVFVPVWTCLNSLANAVALLLRQIGPLVVFGTGMVCLGMYLSCIGLGTVAYRVAFNKQL